MLAEQIGDGILPLKLQVGTKPQPLMNASSLHESSVEVLIRSRRANSAGLIFIGNLQKQEYELTAGQDMPPIRISRPGAIYFRGDATAVAAGDVIFVLIVTTSGKQRQPYGP